MNFHDESCKELLVAWLNDAYSMENALVKVLENHAKDFKDFPQIQNRIQRHVEETKHHAAVVENCVEHLGESVSTVKSALGVMLGAVKGVGTGWAKDELIKDCLMDFGAENFEIGCYQSLIRGAELYGDSEIAQACRDILADEEDMARFLESQIPILTEEMLRIKVESR